MSRPEGTRNGSPSDKKSLGPYAAPLQSEAELTEGEPMAVANDKLPTSSKSHLPTTQSKDAYDPAVAKEWQTVPDSAKPAPSGEAPPTLNPKDAAKGKTPAEETPETVAMMDPPGFTEVDEDGYKRMKWDDSDLE